MSPMINGYSIYVAPMRHENDGWLVRVYRDLDGSHIHSAEPASTLELGLREAERAIREDMQVAA